MNSNSLYDVRMDLRISYSGPTVWREWNSECPYCRKLVMVKVFVVFGLHHFGCLYCGEVFRPRTFNVSLQGSTETMASLHDVQWKDSTTNEVQYG